MGRFSYQHDIGSILVDELAVDPQGVTGGSTATGPAIDRRPGSTAARAFNDLYLSAKLVGFSAGSTQGGFSVKLQHSSATSAGWANFADIDGTTSNSVGAGSTGVHVSADYDLSAAKRYIRGVVINSTAVSSSLSVTLGAVLVLGGGDRPPAD